MRQGEHVSDALCECSAARPASQVAASCGGMASIAIGEVAFHRYAKTTVFNTTPTSPLLCSRVNEAANVLPGWAEREGQLPAPAAQPVRRLQAQMRPGEQAAPGSSGSSSSRVGWRPGERPLSAAP